MEFINLLGQCLGGAPVVSDKYNIQFSKADVIKNVQRLTNQIWKLIPMREHEENWQKQLETVTIEIAGLYEIFNGPAFLQLLSNLEGLRIQEDTDFDTYRSTIFKCLRLLQEVSNGNLRLDE